MNILPFAKALSCSYPILRRLEKPIAYNAANIISASVGALLLWLAFAVLLVFGIVDAGQSSGIGFVATYLIQGLVFLMTLREYSVLTRRRTWILNAVSFAYVILLCACALLPATGELTGAGALSPVSILLAPAAAVVYWITYRILSARGLNLHH